MSHTQISINADEVFDALVQYVRNNKAKLLETIKYPVISQENIATHNMAVGALATLTSIELILDNEIESLKEQEEFFNKL